MSQARLSASSRLPASTATGLTQARRESGAAVSRLARRFGDALRAADTAVAEQVIDDALRAGVSPVEIHALVIEPAMVRIGELWEANAITVADEHLATAISQGVLVKMFDALSFAASRSRERVLLAAVEGQRHVLGMRMIADVLEGAGFDVMYLGADVPTEALRRFVTDHQPALVALGYTVDAEPKKLADAIAAVHEMSDSPRLILGGHGVPQILRDTYPWLSSSLDALSVVEHALHDPPPRLSPAVLELTAAASEQASEATIEDVNPVVERLAGVVEESTNTARKYIRQSRALAERAMLDPIAGIPNRRALDAREALDSGIAHLAAWTAATPHPDELLAALERLAKTEPATLKDALYAALVCQVIPEADGNAPTAGEIPQLDHDWHAGLQQAMFDGAERYAAPDLRLVDVARELPVGADGDAGSNFAAVLDAVDDAVTVCSLDQTFTVWNRSAELLYGYTAAEAIGQPVQLIVPREEQERAQLCWRRCSHGQRRVTIDTVHRRKDGELIPVVTTFAPALNPSGQAEAIVSVTHDQTASKKAAATVAEADARERDAARRWAELTKNLNHELRTPMNGVIGMAALLSDSKLDDEQRECVQGIEHSSAALMAVIHRILDLLSIETGRLAPQNSPFELSAIVDEVCAVARAVKPASSIPVTSAIEPQVPARLMGDCDRIRRVLMKLVSNAVKFTDTGVVSLRVSWISNDGESGRVRFEVADTGVGISPDHKEQIFQPFVQADGSTTRPHNRAGIGLAVAKELVETMGGEIGLHSAPGWGSTFWFELPLRKASTETADGQMPSAAHQRALIAAPDHSKANPARTRARFTPKSRERATARVLVVEDDAVSRRVAVRLVERMGYEVASAVTGREAVDMHTRAPYDVILMDCNLPEMDGYEATAAIRRHDGASRHAKIIALTANATDADAARCFESGMDDYSTKPLNCNAIEELLAQHASPREPKS